MYVTNTKRLTHEGAKRITATAIDKACEAGIAISIAVTDAGGHVIVLERMDGGRFHTLHSATTKAVCASSTRRSTSALGAQGQELDLAHVVGLALAAGAERWTAMEGGSQLCGWYLNARAAALMRRVLLGTRKRYGLPSRTSQPSSSKAN